MSEDVLTGATLLLKPNGCFAAWSGGKKHHNICICVWDAGGQPCGVNGKAQLLFLSFLITWVALRRMARSWWHFFIAALPSINAQRRPRFSLSSSCNLLTANSKPATDFIRFTLYRAARCELKRLLQSHSVQPALRGRIYWLFGLFASSDKPFFCFSFFFPFKYFLFLYLSRQTGQKE